MAHQSVVVNLTPELYERIHRTAQDTSRSLETILVESLALLFGDLDADVEQLIPVLDTLPNEQLWAIVQRRLTWPDSVKLQELMAASKAGELSPSDMVVLDNLLDQVDRYTLLRSHALLLLQKRGQNVEKYLGMNG
jgi:hypothetical protein